MITKGKPIRPHLRFSTGSSSNSSILHFEKVESQSIAKLFDLRSFFHTSSLSPTAQLSPYAAIRTTNQRCSNLTTDHSSVVSLEAAATGRKDNAKHEAKFRDTLIYHKVRACESSFRKWDARTCHQYFLFYSLLVKKKSC